MNNKSEQEKLLSFNIKVGDLYVNKVPFYSGDDSLDMGSHFIVEEIHEDGDVEIRVPEVEIYFTLDKSEIEAVFNDGSLEIENDEICIENEED